MKTRNTNSGVILRVLSVIMMALITTQFLAAQDWYNLDWLYRSQVTVSNPGTTVLTDFQIRITLNSSFDFTKAKIDGSDIRVTSSDGMTLIPFWIEEWNMAGTTGTIWVKVPNIPAAGTSVFIYYGNASATDATNGYNTFEFFDDFESWIQVPMPTSKTDLTCAVYDGKLYAIGGYDNSASDPLSENYEYDPVINTWEIKSPMPTPRTGAVAVESDGDIYVFGGQLESGEGSNLNEKYNPTTDSWISRTGGNPLEIPHYEGEGAVHPDIVYFPDPKDGYEYWMVYTPYPPDQAENPCIVRSHDGITWSDDGISNPVIPVGVAGTWNSLMNPDPDFIYVEEFNKWFMVWIGGDETDWSFKIGLAYSSDGINWTQYDGATVNGNANPVILSGTDDNGAEWETGNDVSKLIQPTLFYDSGIFYLYYAEEFTGNNRGRIGLATFNWNNTANSIVYLDRANGNPIIDIPEDEIFKSGGGHIDISKNTHTGLYHMYMVREQLNSVTYELCLLTSSNYTDWDYQGKVIEIGAEEEWDQTHIYRSCPVTSSAGEIVFFGDDIRMYYSGYTGGVPGIGIASIMRDGYVQKFQGTPWPIPPALAGSGIMGVRLDDTIHLFYENFHYGYCPLTDTYTRKPDVPSQLKWGTCAVVDSKIYIIGGYSDDPPTGATNVNYEWDPSNGVWAIKTPMPVSRYGATRENPVIDGKIYVTHGNTGDEFFATDYMYDPATDTWLQKPSAVHERNGVGCGVINNKLYVVGGKRDLIGPFGTTFNEMYDPTSDLWTTDPTESRWVTSGTEFVFTSTPAAFHGNFGLVIQQTDNVETQRWAESVEGFGGVYALDFDWNVTDIGGVVGGNRPETLIRLTEMPDETNGNLFFYNNTSNIQVLDWFNGYSFNHLQNSARNDWHKVTIVRNDAASRVVFDGNLFEPPQITSPGTEGTGKFRFGLYSATTQYLDNVRVRQWAGSDPVTVVGSEESGNFRQWTGSIDSDWNNTGNWELGVPESTTNVVIRNVTNQPHVNLTGAVCNNLTIDPSASLTIDPGQALRISSSLANNGSLTIESSGLTSSGSLIVSGTSAGNVTYNRQMRTEANDGDYHYFSSPVSSNSATNSTKVNAVWQWNEVTGVWSTLDMSALQSGIGYNLDQTAASDGLISFTGPIVLTDPIVINATSPYNDAINGTELNYNSRTFVQGDGHSGITRDYSDILYGGGGWNMLGNPYTSSILVSDFITANSTHFDPNYVAVYLYDGTSTGHTMYYYIGSPTGWIGAEELISQTHVQVGQGFFVLAMNDYSTFTFNKNMQDHSTGALMLKSGGAKDRWPGLQLKVKSGENENMTTIIFNEDMTVGLDPGYDVGLMSYGPGAGIYTALVEDNGINFTRQALPVNGSVKNIIPVGIDFENGGKITFSADVEPLRNYKFWLEDRMTGIVTDLGTKTYSVTLPAKTYGTGRFFVYVAAGRSIRPRTDNANLLDIRIWSSQDRQVNIQGVVSERATCEVYDTFGHKIFETRLTDGGYNSFNMPSAGKGVYLVKVSDGLKVITVRVVFL